jgi:TetR/AcrR family transcriptional regulator of autoinduction and epiphytic fitness
MGDDGAALAGPRCNDPDDRRRHHLIDSAEAVFLEKGFHSATMDEIARCAGMSKKTIYQVFPSKIELFDVLLRQRLGPLFVPIEDNGGSAEATLTSFLQQMAELILSHKQIALLRLMAAEARRSPEIGKALERQGIGRGDGALERWIAAQADQGVFRVDDPQEAAAMLFGMAIGEFMISLTINSKPWPTQEHIHRRIAQAVQIFLSTYCPTYVRGSKVSTSCAQ